MSDLHFGNAFEFLLDPLIDAVDRLKPDLVVISGDFAEHATGAEFDAARTYIARLPGPRLLVPGNHDLPFYDPLRRLREGLHNYRDYITRDLHPTFTDDEMVVIGVTTPRKFPMKGGRISASQVDYVRQKTCAIAPPIIKVLVTHHPLDLPEDYKRRNLVHRARAAVEALSPCVDLMLAGHLHLSSTGATAARFHTTGHSAIFAQAGTAISMRNKGEPNSFNLIRLKPDEIEIEHQTWDSVTKCYNPQPCEHFEHGAKGWEKCVGAQKKEQVQL